MVFGHACGDGRKALEFFRTAFDRAEAEKEGKIVPRPGVDDQYDDALDAIRRIEADADAYLAKQRQFFGVKVEPSTRFEFQFFISDFLFATFFGLVLFHRNRMRQFESSFYFEWKPNLT